MRAVHRGEAYRVAGGPGFGAAKPANEKEEDEESDDHVRTDQGANGIDQGAKDTVQGLEKAPAVVLLRCAAAAGLVGGQWFTLSFGVPFSSFAFLQLGSSGTGTRSRANAGFQCLYQIVGVRLLAVVRAFLDGTCFRVSRLLPHNKNDKMLPFNQLLPVHSTAQLIKTLVELFGAHIRQ